MKDHLDSSIFGDSGEHETGHEHDDHAPEAHAPSSVGSRDRGGRRRSGRPHPRRRLAVILVALLVVGAGAYAAFNVLRPVVGGILESNDYPGPGAGDVRVRVEEGDTGAAIGRRLVEAGVVKTAKAYLDAASANDKSTSIQPGVYALRKQMAASDVVAVLVEAKNRVTTSVVIPEGLWAKEVYAKLSAQTGLAVADYERAAKDAAALGLPAAAKGNVEGYLFPASYTFDPDTTAASHLKAMVAASVKRLSALGVTPARMEHVVTVASIVEAEARREQDRPKVARVIENRLAAKMSLQLDSTVSYAVGSRTITTTDAARASSSPYNTYKVVGLPAGPIGNPGESALKAAAAPVAGPWLYFVAVNPTTGETRFATTFAEHEQNVALFQQWCQANKGKC
ncbi:MAG TPA: endolytic transglycosylase MltG [Intrasporangium sp.]|uniref:endolytic transglycosylase MltG n=1 Tax=Intrasporangium sp. TaxID=1925024 RepID=UPI002D79060F|nr:endolytic transglycosylase MltG [Intrasporangium sp.]HET7399508.1 endolytic transglycosylase MltG [Intrasporangium sp.]